MTCNAWKIVLIVLLMLAAAGPSPAETPQLVISADMQFAYADTLYQKEDYDTATVEFKRFIHFFPTDSRVDEAAFNVGMALFHQDKFFDAARQFDEIIRQEKKNRFTREAYFMQSRAFVEMGNLGYAQIILQNLLVLTEDPSTRDRIYLDLARLHIQASRQAGTDELDLAKKSVEQISQANARQYHQNEYRTLIEDARNVPEKKPALAGLFATIPGAGYLYCGRYKDALAAFGLNAGLMLAAYTAFEDGNTALGAVVSFVGTGFYSGSIYGSVSAAHKHNHAQRRQILDREYHFDTAIDPVNQAILFSFRHMF